MDVASLVGPPQAPGPGGPWGGTEAAVASAPVLCAECLDVVLCAAVKRVPRTDMVMVPPKGARKTGGRAKFRARTSASKDDRVHSDLSLEAMALRAQHREVALAARKARRRDLILMHALLLHLEDSSQAVMAELHSDKWHPHAWFHWIFPTNVCAVGEIGEASAVTHRTVVDFVLQDTFAWREALERIVGKAESSVGGLLGLFRQIYRARIDCFVGIFAEAPKRAGWLFVVLERLRRLRAWEGGLVAPGYKPKVSRPSRRARLLLAAASRKEDIARSRVEVVVVPAEGAAESSTEIIVAAGQEAVVHGVLQRLPQLARQDRPKMRYDAYFSRKGCNKFIYDCLQNKPQKSVVYAPPVCVSVLTLSPLSSMIGRSFTPRRGGRMTHVCNSLTVAWTDPSLFVRVARPKSFAARDPRWTQVQRGSSRA